MQKHFGVTQAPPETCEPFFLSLSFLITHRSNEEDTMLSQLQRTIYIDPDRASVLKVSSCGFEEVCVSAHMLINEHGHIG